MPTGREKQELGWYFTTQWTEGGKPFAERFDYMPTDFGDARKAHDGAMTFMWAHDKQNPSVSALYDRRHRIARHGLRHGETRPTDYTPITRPTNLPNYTPRTPA